MPATYVPGPHGPMVFASTAGGGGGHSAAYTNFIARTSGLDATHLSAYAALLDGLTTDGFFDGSGNSLLLDGLYLFATADSTTAKLNLVQNAFNLTASGTPTFTADQGFTGNTSTNPFLDTGFTPGTSSGFYARDSACLGIWTRIAGSGATGDCSGMLAGDTSVESSISNAFFSGTAIASSINIAFTGSASLSATGTGVGLAVGNRSASNANQLYYGGSSVATSATVSAALTSAVSLTFLTRHFGTGANQTSDEQILAGLFGGSMSSTNHSNLFTRLGTFKTAVGA